MTTVRLTVAQALVRFLASQYSERDGARQRLIAGCFGIFGHGYVAGVGQALLQAALLPTAGTGEADLRYYLARNEQAMVHASVGFARMRNRLQTLACTASIGPGSTNMVTGAALATIGRIPVLLLPSDFFATRAASPVLQELEDPRSYDVSVNDAFRPVSRFWDRINRPEQLPSALLAAMRVLTDPAETGAVTLALPQDVQAEAHDWPDDLFAERTWYVPRPVPEPAALDRAVAVLRSARRPLVTAISMPWRPMSKNSASPSRPAATPQPRRPRPSRKDHLAHEHDRNGCREAGARPRAPAARHLPRLLGGVVR